MLLYVIRHGIAIDREDPDCPPEAQRYLTPEGVTRTREAARGLSKIAAKPDILLTSPFVRALQTAEIVAAAFRLPNTSIRKTRALEPSANPRAIFQEIAKLHGKDVACFGHAPHLDEMIAAAIGAKTATELKKAGAACLEMRSLTPPRGALAWLLTAKMLRKLG